MKSLRSFLSFAALTVLAASATTYDVPYSSTFGNGTTFDPDWTFVDNNKDGDSNGNGKWNYEKDSNSNSNSVTGTTEGIYYKYSSKNAADDWAISPAITLESGKSYRISYWNKRGNANYLEKLKVYLSNEFNESKPIESFTDPIITSDDIPTTWTQGTYDFSVEEDGEYYFAFQVCSAADKHNLYLRAFNIEELVTTPAAVTDLAVTPGADMALSATITWTLPTTDTTGKPLEETLTSVTVKRDGNVVETLPGTTTSFEDNADKGLVTGIHTYAVSVMLGEVSSEEVSFTTGWIGPKDAKTLPYEETFKDADEIENLWTVIDLDGDMTKTTNTMYPIYYSWGRGQNAMGNQWWMGFYSDASHDANDWVISAPLKFESAGKYKVSFACGRYTGSTTPNLKVYAGKGDTAADMTIELGTVTDFTIANVSNPSGATNATKFEQEFKVSAGGIYYIGIYAGYHVTAATNIRLNGFKVELIEAYEEETAPETPVINIEGAQYDEDDDAHKFDSSTTTVTVTFEVPEGENVYHSWVVESGDEPEAALEEDVEVDTDAEEGFVKYTEQLSINRSGSLTFYAAKNGLKSEKTTVKFSDIYDSGVSSIVIGANGEATFYNIQGVRVNNPENGLYIRRSANGSVEKVFVK